MEPAQGLWQTGGMSADPISTWLGFLISPAAPRTAMPPMELDGYLTGVVVSPDLLPPSDWLAGLWGENEPHFDSQDQLQTVLSAVMDHYNAISAALARGFENLEAKKPADYRPMFLAGGDKPGHEIVRTWVRGFAKAMALSPQGWISLAEDERLQPLLAPFVGFTDFRDKDYEPADYIDELLDESAAAIPQAAIVLYKLAQITGRSRAGRRSKTGRNDPCPCGSGLKYKRCCGADRSSTQ